MMHRTVEINVSECGRFAETDLLPWARRHYRTEDGVRENLAGSLGIERNSNAQVVHELLVPVLTAHHIQVMKYTTGPADEGKPQTEALAWLATGAECSAALSVAPLFVLYYVVEQVKGEVCERALTALANEINRRGVIFKGEMWEGYTPRSIVQRILDQPRPAEYAADIMREAVRAANPPLPPDGRASPSAR